MNSDHALPGFVPRHRPGHRSRVTDLHGRIRASRLTGDASGAAVDPLAGNYTLVRLEDIVVGYPRMDGSQAQLQIFPVSEPTMSTTGDPLSQGAVVGAIPPEGPGGSSSQTGAAAVAVADFNGDGRDEAALGFLFETPLCPTNVMLMTAAYSEATGAFTTLAPATPWGTSYSEQFVGICLAAGYLKPDAPTQAGAQPAQLVIAYYTPSETIMFDGLLQIDVCDASGPSPTCLVSDTSIPIAGGAFDIAVADVDGDGIDELAVAWQGGPTAPTDLTLQVFKWCAGGDTGLTLLAKTTIAAGNGLISLKAGNLDPDSPGQDQLVLAWSALPQTSGEGAGIPCLQVFAYSPGSEPVLTSSPAIWSDAALYPLTNPALVRVGVGDLNQDGVDEVVLASEAGGNLVLRSFAVDGTLSLNLASTGRAGAAPGTALLSNGLSVAIGAPTPAGTTSVSANAIVVGGVGDQFTLAVIETGADLAFPASMTAGVANLTPVGATPGLSADGIPVVSVAGVGLEFGPGEHPAQTFTVSLGDFSGRSITVGSPTYSRAESVNGVIAAINAPPSQILAGAQTPANTWTNFIQSDDQETSLTLNVSRDWGHSTTLEAKLGIPQLGAIDASLTKTYGIGFSKATEAIASVNTGLAAMAQFDDEILLSVTDYDVWEYPVYTQGAQVGNILVVFPDVPGGTPQTKLVAGLDLDSYYAPPHQILQLMSYPITDPPDYLAANALYDCGVMETNANNNSTQSITWSDVISQDNTTSSKVNLDVSASADLDPSFLGGLKIGLGIKTNDTYSQNSISTNEVEFSQTTEIQVILGQLSDIKYQYTVTPFLYWSIYGNYLVVNYKAAIVEGSYWSSTYNCPWPTLSLPWNTNNNLSSTASNLQLLSRSIVVSAPGDSGAVQVQVTVLNFGLEAAENVTATFYCYEGDLNELASSLPPQAQLIGSAQSIPTIAAQSSEVASIAWTPPDPNAIYAIYCQVGGDTASWYGSLGSDQPPPGQLLGYNTYPADYFSQASVPLSHGSIRTEMTSPAQGPANT